MPDEAGMRQDGFSPQSTGFQVLAILPGKLIPHFGLPCSVGMNGFQSRIRPGDEVKITLLGAREHPGSLRAWNPVWEMEDSVSVIFEEYYFEVLVNGSKRYIGQSLIERYTESSTIGGGVRYHVERDRINADSQKKALEELVDWMESGHSANNDWHSLKAPDEVKDIPDGLPYYPE